MFQFIILLIYAIASHVILICFTPRTLHDVLSCISCVLSDRRCHLFRCILEGSRSLTHYLTAIAVI